jgi:hypothetical protein
MAFVIRAMGKRPEVSVRFKSHATGMKSRENDVKQALELNGVAHGRLSPAVKNRTKPDPSEATSICTDHLSSFETTLDTLNPFITAPTGVIGTHCRLTGLVPGLHLPHPSIITVFMLDGSMHMTHVSFSTFILALGQHSPVDSVAQSQPKGSESATSALILTGNPFVMLTM